MNNYKLLPSLISILQTRNLTESAKQLNVTQSAMSKTLNQIRDAFHDKIVIREANQFVLTTKGEALKAQLPSLLQQLDNLYLPEAMDLASCSRSFSFASSDYVAQAIFPTICNKFQQLVPNANIEYELWNKNKLTELADDPVDLVSTIAETIPENLHGKLMAEDQLVIVSRKTDLPLSGTMSVNDYTKAQHVLISGGGDKDSPVDRELARIGKQRNIAITVPFFQSAIEILLTTDTMLTTPLHIAADLARNYNLQVQKLPLKIKPHSYYLLWHAKYHQEPEHKWFRELCFPVLKEHLEQTIEHGMKLIHTNK